MAFVVKFACTIVSVSGGASRQEMGGTKGDRGPRPLYARKRPFLLTGNAHVYSRGNALQMQLNIIRSSETVKILGLLIANVANKAMSARYGGNETLVSTSHSDMIH